MIAMIKQLVVDKRTDQHNKIGPIQRQTRVDLAELFRVESQLTTPVLMRSNQILVQTPNGQSKTEVASSRNARLRQCHDIIINVGVIADIRIGCNGHEDNSN